MFGSVLSRRWVGPFVMGLILAGILSVVPDAAVAAERKQSGEFQLAQGFFVPGPPPGYYKRRYRRRYRRRIRRRIRRRARCGWPWRYSRASRGCTCNRPGYQLKAGRCLKVQQAALQEACQANAVWSTEQAKCSCKPGYLTVGKRCVSSSTAALITNPSASRFQPTRNLARIQQCLRAIGYEPGRVDGKGVRKTWSAYWHFKNDQGLLKHKGNVFNPLVQKHMFALCSDKLAVIEDAKVAALGPTALPPRGRGDGSGPKAKSRSRPVSSRACVLPSYHKLLIKTYGPRSGIPTCKDACIPKPRGISKREMVVLTRDRGVKWCDDCIRLSTYLPLEDIQRIERSTGRRICAQAPDLDSAGDDEATDAKRGAAYTKVRSIYRRFPPSQGNHGNIAVIIGNSHYAKDWPAHNVSANDAGAVRALLTEHMGYADSNIIDLRNAKLADMMRVFGTAENPVGELARRVRDRPKANVLVYYSGHGLTGYDQADSYILPVDAEMGRLAETAFPVSRLYQNLSKAGAAAVFVLLEAEFGFDPGDYVLPPNLPELPVKVIPTAPVAGVTIITAGSGDQRTLQDPTYRISLFTRYMIEGLSGLADTKPIGNGDGKIDMVELYAYAANHVQLAAQKSFGLIQKPVLSNSGNKVLSKLGQIGQ